MQHDLDGTTKSRGVRRRISSRSPESEGHSKIGLVENHVSTLQIYIQMDDKNIERREK